MSGEEEKKKELNEEEAWEAYEKVREIYTKAITLAWEAYAKAAAQALEASEKARAKKGE